MPARLVPKTNRCSLGVPRAKAYRYAPITTTPATNPFQNGDVVPPTSKARKPARERVFQQVPLSDLVRTLSVLSVAALPAPLLAAIIAFVRRHSSAIVSSRILSWPLRRTFYNAFCVGETRPEIAANIAKLRARGIDGVVLSFAREAKLDGSSTSAAPGAHGDAALKSWVQSNVETINQVGASDYIAVKFTGAGAASVKAMHEFEAGDDAASVERLAALREAVFEVCRCAQRRGVKVMVDAESSAHQPAIDHLTLEAMAAFNTEGSALVHNTYQMYLKSSPATLKAHLALAAARGYTLGVKLVRGAYIYVEPQRGDLIQPTKPSTDAAYDAAVALLLRGPARAEVMLATHNAASVDAALALYTSSSRTPSAQPQPQPRKLVFAQLMGMADEVSMKLAREIAALRKDGERGGAGVSVYKYSVWGSLEDCLLYMLRRAEENQDAAKRSRVTAGLMLGEIWERVRFWR